MKLLCIAIGLLSALTLSSSQYSYVYEIRHTGEQKPQPLNNLSEYKYVPQLQDSQSLAPKSAQDQSFSEAVRKQNSIQQLVSSQKSREAENGDTILNLIQNQLKGNQIRQETQLWQLNPNHNQNSLTPQPQPYVVESKPTEYEPEIPSQSAQPQLSRELSQQHFQKLFQILPPEQPPQEYLDLLSKQPIEPNGQLNQKELHKRQYEFPSPQQTNQLQPQQHQPLQQLQPQQHQPLQQLQPQQHQPLQQLQPQQHQPLQQLQPQQHQSFQQLQPQQHQPLQQFQPQQHQPLQQLQPQQYQPLQQLQPQQYQPLQQLQPQEYQSVQRLQPQQPVSQVKPYENQAIYQLQPSQPVNQLQPQEYQPLQQSPPQQINPLRPHENDINLQFAQPMQLQSQEPNQPSYQLSSQPSPQSSQESNEAQRLSDLLKPQSYVAPPTLLTRQQFEELISQPVTNSNSESNPIFGYDINPNRPVQLPVIPMQELSGQPKPYDTATGSALYQRLRLKSDEILSKPQSRTPIYLNVPEPERQSRTPIYLNVPEPQRQSRPPIYIDVPEPERQSRPPLYINAPESQSQSRSPLHFNVPERQQQSRPQTQPQSQPQPFENRPYNTRHN